MEFLNHNDSPAVLDVYTPCQGEQGIAGPEASRHGRLAVESRMNPVFVHDPRRGADLHSRFSLDGNPDSDKDWTTNTIEYVEDGALKLMEAPLTPADFALIEGRFRKQFRPLAADAVGAPIHEYVELGTADRAAKRPFVWSTDDDKKLIKVEASQTIVHLVQERRKNWRTLQYLAGLDVAKLDADHHVDMEALKRQYQEAAEARESSIDSIARAMSELAASSKATSFSAPSSGAVAGVATTRLISASPAPAPAAKADGSVPVTLAEADVPKCNNCKTCYQEIPELFEKTRIVVDGAAKEVGHLIPGALARVNITPELKRRIERVAANCDAEIIHAH